jgi:hypothetical protein
MAAAEINDLSQRGGREGEQLAAAQVLFGARCCFVFFHMYRLLGEQAVADRARRSFEEEERRWVFCRFDFYNKVPVQMICYHRNHIRCCGCLSLLLQAFARANSVRHASGEVPLPSRTRILHIVGCRRLQLRLLKTRPPLTTFSTLSLSCD